MQQSKLEQRAGNVCTGAGVKLIAARVALRDPGVSRSQGSVRHGAVVEH